MSPPQNKLVFCPAPTKVSNNPKDFGEFEFSFPHKDIARSVFWLLENDTPILGLDDIRQRYVFLLQKKDLATFRGRIRQGELTEAFINFYSPSLLHKAHSMLDNNLDQTWLSRLLQKPRNACHPIRHILLMRFLEMTPENFFSLNNQDSSPFGEPPWPCVNPACEHYLKDSIWTCIVSRDYDSGCPVGTFACKCGFTYSRKGPDREKNLQYIIGRIKSFGDEWHRKLWEFIGIEKCSLREAARRLKVDVGTIKNQLAIYLGEKLQFKSTSENGAKRAVYQKKMLLTLRLYPDRSRTEIRAIIPGVYAWLYRHDRIWLYSNLPPTTQRRIIKSRVDWIERDLKICEEIIEAVNVLKNREPLVRVTISSLGKMTGRLSLLHKHLDKLPRTRELLMSSVESIREYQDRRILYVIRQMESTGITLKAWKVMRAAGLRTGNEENIQMILDSRNRISEERLVILKEEIPKCRS